MANIFKAFVAKHEAAGKTGLIKTLKFYLDYLEQYDFIKILAALEDEIQASKRATQEMTKMETERIKNFEELLGSPDQHIKSIKEASEKLLQFEKQLLAADAEKKKLLIENKEASENFQASETKF